MSDAAPTATDGGNDGTTPPADEFKPITSQADLDKVIGERIKREQSKYADYKDLKAKAAKLDEQEQANLSEIEKAQAKVTATEAERDAARAEALRLRTAVEHGISIEDADLFLTGTDAETLTAQAKRLVDREADRKKNGNHVPREGASAPPQGDESDRAFARSLFTPSE